MTPVKLTYLSLVQTQTMDLLEGLKVAYPIILI